MIKHFIKEQAGGGGDPFSTDIKILLSSKDGTNKLL